MPSDGLVLHFIAGHFHKTESAASARYRGRVMMLIRSTCEWLKHLSQFVFRRVELKFPQKYSSSVFLALTCPKCELDAADCQSESF